MQIFYIDHYDSFSFNLIDWLGEIDHKIEITYVAFDDPALQAKFAENPMPIVLSPGPNSPLEAGPTSELVAQYIGKVPILGVCLGHQILGCIAGYQLTRSKSPIHGARKKILVGEASAFYPTTGAVLEAAVYNSLVLQGEARNKAWKVTGYSEVGEVQMIENLANPTCPCLGLQFHPESFLSQGVDGLQEVWGNILRDFYSLDS